MTGAVAVGGVGVSGGTRYRFLRRLAIGGMAELYEAEAVGVAGVVRRVAVKRILPQLAAGRDFREMFIAEARLAATLQHPNIVHTLDTIERDGDHYIVMELLDGLDLLTLVRRLHHHGRAFPAPLVLYIVERVLSALHYAHERTLPDGTPLHIVHRDVSPQNIFLTRHGAVKLLDFGIAKAAMTLQTETLSEVIKGKILYMSPEQCVSTETGPPADLYSVGVVMYHLLTGQYPFRGRNHFDTMRSIIDDPVPSPSTHGPLWPELEAVVLRALQKRPGDRYASAREMQRAVAEVISGRRCFVSEPDFVSFIEEVRGLEPPPREQQIEESKRASQLPPELLAQPEGLSGVTQTACTEHAALQRLAGVSVVRLFGVIDERFDPEPVLPWMSGIVLVDSGGVERITSYGIRGLLALFEASGRTVSELYHVSCSVAFVTQMGLMRRLLGGGRVLSFQAPYLDPSSGMPFSVTLEGVQAATALATHQPPRQPCPGAPDQAAVFDEDAERYFCFAEDFLSPVPGHVARVVEAIQIERRQQLIEKDVTEDGTILWIRRPLVGPMRWGGLFRGLEGNVRLDLGAVPAWTDVGLDAMVLALSREADGVAELQIVGAPWELVQRCSVPSCAIHDKVRIVSAQIPTSCTGCGVRRISMIHGAA
ncbi:MAG TPA: serine/threonine protein kinase, partial [Deltaproteobacteria bacterium]|nr:serine/threonine protein kinase [Deltaproteobacteria bacterium]